MNDHPLTCRRFLKSVGATAIAALFLLCSLALAADADASAADAARAEAKITNPECWELGPFVKYPEPVLRPTPRSIFRCPVRGKEVRWEERNVYNPAAVVRDGKVYLLYRADDISRDLGWGRTCRIGLAYSEDGIHFTRHPGPVLYPDNDEWKQYEWEGGCEDLHIIEGEDGVYVMNYTTWRATGSGRKDTMSIATSRDLLARTGVSEARTGHGDGIADRRGCVPAGRRPHDCGEDRRQVLDVLHAPVQNRLERESP